MSNPFATHDIMIPEEYREHFDRYVQKKDGKAAQPIHQPFARNIDMWFFALCLAVKKKLKPVDHTGKKYKAAEGVVLSSDSWHPTAIVLLALAETKDIKVVEDPGKMLGIASRYALAGMPELLTLLGDLQGETPLDTLCEEIEGLLANADMAAVHDNDFRS
ncbi:hypothetical protein [Pararhodospirillum photometricum]|uniref:hypothetical protein n=1 Tax=Pararhodospirillum photometricum TaxID=1084 RepID=UPI0005A1580F|nr:hypothetical protein [Pararhodospirillum photometricum]